MSETYEAAMEIRIAIDVLTAAIREQTATQQGILIALQFISQSLIDQGEK